MLYTCDAIDNSQTKKEYGQDEHKIGNVSMEYQ